MTIGIFGIRYLVPETGNFYCNSVQSALLCPSMHWYHIPHQDINKDYEIDFLKRRCPVLVYVYGNNTWMGKAKMLTHEY